MWGKITRFGAIVLVGMLLVGAAVSVVGAAPIGQGNHKGVLSDAEIEALGSALDDEYKARATYTQVIDDLGEISPFTQIVIAEQTHVDALVALFVRYELEVPEDEWPGNVPTFLTRPEACAGGVEAEIDNVALYDELLPTVNRKDITTVFTALKLASLENHLPAFTQCAPSE